jgi:hypothetical protein
MTEEKKNYDDFVFKFMTGLLALFVLIMFVACFFQLLWNNTLVNAISVLNPISSLASLRYFAHALHIRQNCEYGF